MMRVVLQIVGAFAVLMGLLWIGQGLGLVMWPASSFMLARPQWAAIGAVLVVLGGLAFVRARRR